MTAAAVWEVWWDYSSGKSTQHKENLMKKHEVYRLTFPYIVWDWWSRVPVLWKRTISSQGENEDVKINFDLFCVTSTLTCVSWAIHLKFSSSSGPINRSFVRTMRRHKFVEWINHHNEGRNYNSWKWKLCKLFFPYRANLVSPMWRTTSLACRAFSAFSAFSVRDPWLWWPYTIHELLIRQNIKKLSCVGASIMYHSYIWRDEN